MQDTKLCTGPAHPVPVQLPLTEDNWYFHKRGKRVGKPLSRCKLCVNWNRLQSAGQSGTVPCSSVHTFVAELVSRYGSRSLVAEAAGVALGTVDSIMNGDTCTVQKRTALRIIVALDEKRREDRRRGFVHERFIKERQQVAQRIAQLERHQSYD